MSYEKKVQLNLDGNIYYTSQTGNNEKVTEDNSIFSAENIQNTQSVESSNCTSDNEYIDIEFDEDSKNTYSANSNYENIDENELIIKQLEAEIAKLESEYEASQKGKGIVGAVGGFFSSCWNGITGKGFKDGARVELDNKIALLEAAKSDPAKLAQAYKEIMGADLTDELKQSTIEAQNVADNLSKEEKQQIIDLLKEQAASLSQLMQQTKDDQGWFSKTMGGINNVFGFGTNSIKANAKVEEFIKQVNSLNPDDADFAAKYQSLTGEALSLEGLSELSQGVSKVGNSSAAEAIMDYEETQASAKEIGTGIVVGLGTAAAIIGLPFTGGMSAVALVGFGAAVGGTATVAINYSDTWFTSKNYSLEQGILDFGGGAINGAVTAMTLGGSQLAGQGFKVLKGAGSAAAKQTAEEMVSGGFKNTVKGAFGSFGKAALRGAKIAAFSSTSNYMLNTVGTNAIYDISGNYTKSEAPTNIVQNEDGTYSVYYELKDSNTGKTISYEIEKVDSISQDNEGNLIKGNILETSRSNNFNFGDLVKQTAISMGSAAIGAGIGKVTNNIINPYATTLTNSVIWGNTAEIVSDAALSLGADYLIASAQAGEFVDKDEFFSWDRILGEGRNQIRGLLIGIASSKVQYDEQLAFNAARSGFDGKTGSDMADIPKTSSDIDIVRTSGDTNTIKTSSYENFFATRTNDDVTSRTQTDLPTVKLDDTSLPKTQQEVLETAGRLILEENNPGKADELLSAYGMSEAEITKFFTEAIKVKQDMGLTTEKTTTQDVNSTGKIGMQIQSFENSKTYVKLQNAGFDDAEIEKVVQLGYDDTKADTYIKLRNSGIDTAEAQEVTQIGFSDEYVDKYIGARKKGLDAVEAGFVVSRAMMLVKYFPNTVAKVAKLIQQNTIGELTEEIILKRIDNAPEYEDKTKLSKKTVRQLSYLSNSLAVEYKNHEAEATKQITDSFGQLETVEKVTGRAKSENSTYEKLAKKTADGKLKTIDVDTCRSKIGDAYGTRVQMKNLGQSDVESVLNDLGINCSYKELCQYISGNRDNLSYETIETLQLNNDIILDTLKTKQNSEVVDLLIDKINNDPNFQITELNNYGSKTSSYFTVDQVKRIAAAYSAKTGKPLSVVTMEDIRYGQWTTDEKGNIIYKTNDYEVTNKGAKKDSGYTSAQMNTEQTFEDTSVGNGELQIRGINVNKFGDVEHIPYDIKQGKIKADDPKYGEIYQIIKSLDEPSYNAYNKYLTEVYECLRMSELGIETPIPQLSKNLTGEIEINGQKKTISIDPTKIDYEALMKFGH